ncbi:MAG: hypothetical protein ACRDHU_14210 [Actinomycetota bacterium]
MRLRRRAPLAALAFLLASGTLGSIPASGFPADAERRIRFLPECPVELPTDRPVDCGELLVPETWGDPDSPTISVAFAIVRGHEPVRRDPVVFLQGGPSYPAIDPFSVTVYFDRTPYTKHRDLILVDVRGTGSSTPS